MVRRKACWSLSSISGISPHSAPHRTNSPYLTFHRLDGYSWRATESHLNTALPQFRTSITIPPCTNPYDSQTLRCHFVHKRSPHANAIPLLIVHSWPSSFIEVQRIIDALVDPAALPGVGKQQAFHVVAPSIPGFGFSDAGESEGFGVKETAAVFDGVMVRLGYCGYVAHGVGW
jgi:pimeloyl-ACP methyl ester carboxylesterase